VEGVRKSTNPASPGFATIIPNVLIAEADVIGLPKTVRGTIDLPGTVELTASPPLGEVNLKSARNFVVPDPTPAAEPSREVRPGLTVTPSDANLQKLVFFGRQDTDTDRLLFRGYGRVKAVAGFGFKTQRDAARNLLDTRVITVDFGRDSTVRVYADVDLGTAHLLGDVTIPDVPAGMTLCFRGAKDDAASAEPVAPVFCDRAPADDQGAFQFVARPKDPSKRLDVHAFVRLSTGAGADVLAGRVDILNVPRVVQGTFGGEATEVAGFDALDADGSGTGPDGIDRIGFHLASFDIADHGYSARPYAERRVERDPFPAVATARQHVGLAADDTDFELVGRIGEVEPSAVAGSDLRRILIANRACAKPAGFGSRPDFPFYPNEVDAGGNPVWSYTCVRGDFEEVGPDAPDPLDLHAVIDRGGERIAVRQAGLTEIPSFFQLNLAEGPSLVPGTDPNRALRPPCGSSSLANCAPPFIRFDTPGESVLAGVAEFGRISDLALVGDPGLDPRSGDTADLDAAPGLDGCGWGDWAACAPGNSTAGAKGIRAKVGRFGEPSGESRTAVRAGLRLLVPPSLTVDQIQSWSVASLAPYVSASDLRFHYIVRDVNGSVVPSLGELTALVHSFADGDQIVITDSRNPARGFPVPGEIGLGLFVRDHKQNGRMMLQIDGRLSVQENIRARIFSPTATNLDANILSVPALTTGSWPQDPSFRLRAEVLSEGDSPPPPGSGSSGGGGTGDPPKEDSCSVLYCLETQVRLKEVHALFDFAPSGTPARLLEAVVNTGGTKNGVQVKGWSTVNGGAAAPITARADVLVSPINVFLHAGIPIIGSFDFILLSDLAAGIRIENSSDFQLRQNLLHVTGESNGFSVPTSVSALVPCAGVSCLFVDYRIYQLHGIAFSLIGLLWGNPVLLGVDYLPPSLPRPPIDSFADPTGLTGAVPVEFRDCRTFGQVGTTNILPITPGIGANAVVFPDLDRLIFYGTLAPIFEGVKFIADLVAPVFCFFPADAEEIPLVGPSGTSPGDANRNPGNPLSMFSQHPVPGIAAASDGAAPVSGPVAPQPLTVSGTLALCGDRIFDRVTVPSGATLQVAGAADASDLVIGGVNLGDRCPAGSEGRLAITAVRAVTVGNGGKVAGAGGTLSLIGETVTVAAGGSVTGSTGRVVLASANDLTVAGSVRADGVSSSPPAGGTSATGNSGGGHGGKGGDGSDGTGGGAYGDTTFVPDDDDGLVVVERGAPGSSVTAGKGAGRGGGALSLLAGQRVLISGPVTADGVEGVVRTSSECASGEKGVGGGSGGAILLAAPSVQIQGGGSVRAVGGFGRTGPGGGGGGGAGGRVKVKSPLFTGTPSLGGGSAGGALGCMGAAVGSPGAGGQLVRDPTPTSNVLPFLDFWQRGSPLPVTFSAAAGLAGDPADPSDDFQVVLCGFPVRADRPDRDLTPADNKADGLQQSFPPMAGTLQPPSAAAPCGSYAFPDSFFNADPVLLGSRSFTNATTAFGQTISANMPLPPDVRGNGFWGVWTNVLKPGTDTNNCLDHTDIGGFLGLFYDLIDCSVEPNPGTPETVFGFDNTPPNFDVEAAGLALSNADGVKVSLSSRITLSIAPPQGATTPDFDIMAGDVSTVGLSGLKLFRCSNDGATFVPCQAGAQQWDLAGGTGSRTVTVQAFDLAGNVTTKMVTVVVDTLAPTSAGQIRAALPPGVELKNNGWYTASPQFRLFGFADPDQADGTKGSGFGGYAYRFDEGMERTNCDPASPAGECLITDPLELPGPGRHTLYWQAVDQLGNRQTLQSLPVRIDGESPLVAFSTVPAAPDGANGWFTGPTFGAVSAFDRPAGGSGLKVKAGDPPADPGTVFGAFYGIDGPANIPVGGAFPIPAGTHFVCYRAMDVAGNTAGQACTASIRVDLAPPDVAIVPSPAVPD
ncbi:MAG: hypothetical protein ACRD0M_00840, partial [Acidimicrobiales bacterium]